MENNPNLIIESYLVLLSMIYSNNIKYNLIYIVYYDIVSICVYYIYKK